MDTVTIVTREGVGGKVQFSTLPEPGDPDTGPVHLPMYNRGARTCL